MKLLFFITLAYIKDEIPERIGDVSAIIFFYGVCFVDIGCYDKLTTYINKTKIKQLHQANFVLNPSARILIFSE